MYRLTVRFKQEFSGLMAQSGEKIWTRRFQSLVGLVLAAQSILIVIVYISFGYSYAAAELALTAFLLLCGVGLLSLLRETTPRNIVLGAGFFVLTALLTLIASHVLQEKIAGRQQADLLRQVLSYWVLVIALLAFEGKVVTRIVAGTHTMLSKPTSWFIRLSHLALAGIAGIELVLQISFGNQFLLIPFASRLYDGLSLNSVAALLLIAIIVCSLLRFNSPLTRFDGWMVLILSFACFLLQYTFGRGELASIDPGMSPSQVVGLSLALSIVPLVLALFALFSEWGRFVAMLWLAIQLLILQPFLGEPLARTRAGGVFQPVQSGQLILYVLAIALLMLALRLLLFWNRRQLNVADGIAVVVVTLVLSLTLWSVGQSYIQQAQSSITTPQGFNLLSLADSLIAIAYLIGISIVLTLGLICANRLLPRHHLWLRRIESLVESIMVLGVAIGALLLLNSIGKQSDYLAAATLNSQVLNANLPVLSISNQYVLDGLFVLLLLIYASALARQRWNRTFGNTERMLVLLSGGTCLLILASPGRPPVLPLVSSAIQQIVEHSLPVFTAERIVTTSILAAALVSLFWLTLSRNRTDRIVLIALFGSAALCALMHYFFTPTLLLLLALILLMLGTLIAAKMELVQQESRAHVEADTIVQADADTGTITPADDDAETSILNGEVEPNNS